jgi:hypothetical protein
LPLYTRDSRPTARGQFPTLHALRLVRQRITSKPAPFRTKRMIPEVVLAYRRRSFATSASRVPTRSANSALGPNGQVAVLACSLGCVLNGEQRTVWRAAAGSAVLSFRAITLGTLGLFAPPYGCGEWLREASWRRERDWDRTFSSEIGAPDGSPSPSHLARRSRDST